MNIPNFLTMIRFILIPIFIYYFFSGIDNGIVIASIIFVIAGLTDILDGFIARKFNLITKLGIVLDPLADKLMLITVLICITFKFNIPLWIIIIVGLKETLMVMGAIALYNDHDIVVPANRFGKVSTILSYAAILAINFNLPYSRLLLNLFLAVTIVALTVYLNNFVNIKKQSKLNIIKK